LHTQAETLMLPAGEPPELAGQGRQLAVAFPVPVLYVPAAHAVHASVALGTW